MKTIESKRIILRAFTEKDWPDVHELAIDWAKAPGPAFDKWPTTENDTKGLADYFSKSENIFAVSLRENNKVVGMLGLNGIDSNKQLDLGHVILTKYKANDYDKEALEAMIEYVFRNAKALSIVTRNDSSDIKQIAPLKSLGFKNINKAEKGELVITKQEWENIKKK